MSKQHKMRYRDKKYITKIVSSYSCDECVFADFTKLNICNLKNDNTGYTGCSPSYNKDKQCRVWVEDKSDDKPKKEDHAWLIEYYDDIEADWFIWTASKTRKVARDCAKSLVSKTRVRKFVPVK